MFCPPFRGVVRGLLAGVLVAGCLCALDRPLASLRAAEKPAATRVRAKRDASQDKDRSGPLTPASKVAKAKQLLAAPHGTASSAKRAAKAAGPAKLDAAPANETPVKLPKEIYSTGYSGSYARLVKFINEELRTGWQENNVAPSAVADDGEWVRRVSLDIAGHIPDLETVESFLSDKSKDKRAKFIDELLDDAGYVRNFTTIWTNNLIGRSTRGRDRLNRPALEKFLRMAFAKNRPWKEIVADLVSAEGHYDENGAVNFLLAHLNDGAVPATAITARLFLGMQIQCTQCHKHPFNEWKQDQFWEFNSFFKQARRLEHRKYDEKTGRMVIDYVELTSNDFEGPVYYEQRNAEMRVAYPRFGGADVEPGATTNRRKELAKLMTAGEKPQIAYAMVNRMWGHFFGYGFTVPIDDMRPDITPSNPALLERLTEEFVKSNYDLKQLICWICNSEAYNLTSRFNKQNERDNPPAGETPLFSHMYLKSMTAEQLYDSLIVATAAHKSGRSNWEQAEKQRQQWLQQFFTTFGTDENDESTTFDGTIPQALMLMNGELIKSAISNASGSLLHSVLTERTSDFNKVRKLYLATLCRVPSRKEFTTAQKVLSGSANALEAYQDLFWALLNSNEFIFNH